MSEEEVTPTSGTEEEKAVADDTPAAEDDAPAAAEEKEDDADAGDAADAEPKKKKKRTAKPKKPIEAPKNLKSGHPRCVDMIIYAIESLADRKGSSVQAIKAFIIKTYPTVNQKQLKSMLKQSLGTCMDAGAIKRPNPDKEDRGVLNGRYKIVKAAQSTNPTCEEMVVAAVGALDERKGATGSAIKGWILENYDHVRPDMLRHQVRMGLTKAIAKGSVDAKTPSKGAKVSLNGRFTLKGAAKKELLKEKAAERKAEEAKEAAKKKAADARAAAKKKSVAAKKAAPKKPVPKKATKAAAPKRAAPKKRSRR